MYCNIGPILQFAFKNHDFHLQILMPSPLLGIKYIFAFSKTFTFELNKHEIKRLL